MYIVLYTISNTLLAKLCKYIHTKASDLIDNKSVKFNIVSKFWIYGKIMHILRTVKTFEECTINLDKIHTKLYTYLGLILHTLPCSCE